MHNDSERQINQLATALEQANATIRSRTDELSLVRRVGDAISHHTSVWALSTELVNAVAETVNCKYAIIYAGTDGSPFELQAVSSAFSAVEELFPKTIRASHLAQSLERSRTPIQIRNVVEDPVWCAEFPFPKSLLSWLCVPLLVPNGLRGILCLADDAPDTFDEKTLRTLMIVVPQISGALANIELYSHLRDSEVKHRTLVEGMQDVVYICDSQWKILEVNPAAEVLFGGKVVGKTLTELFAAPDEAREFVAKMRSANIVGDFETEMLTAREERIVTLVSSVRNRDRYLGIIKDITERTRLVDQVMRSQKMESIGTLASGVAHDFNNILGIILPNAELIRRKAGADPSIGRYTDVIINASKRAAQLTKQLLSFSRKDPRSLRVLNLNDAIHSTCILLGETLDRNIELKVEPSTQMANIKADESQIEQVLLNLAINARDAMPDGGVLKFSTRIQGRDVILTVTDTGTGIDRVSLPKIFDPFFTTKDKSKGTGLGLSVVYGIVKHLGGSIDVRTEVGRGTEFVLTFPSAQEEKSKHAAVPQRHSEGGSEKILVVDDEPEMVELLRTSMESLGYTVLSAQNGAEAVELASSDIQLVIMDMIMPVMDGLTALRIIRQKFPQMKVLVSSGYTNPEKMPLLERMGVEGFLQKPFELQKLTSAVRDVLDGIIA